MPTYDYACEACSHEFEHFQSITSSPLRKCPECGERKLKRLIGAGAGLLFKGSGFYITDYRSEGYKEAAKKDAPKDKKKDSKDKSSSGKKSKSKEKAA